jgi:hypothetical protein
MDRLGLECVAETTIAASGARPWKPRGAERELVLKGRRSLPPSRAPGD